MLNILYSKRTSAKIKDFEIGESELTSAKNIFFCVLSRYGDSIIALQILKEFQSKHKDKHYIIVVSKQLLPYAKEILESKNTTIVTFNKKNPLSLMRLLPIIKNCDIGLNPYGYGSESEYLISHCKKFFFFKEFSKRNDNKNLFDKIRDYLKLDIPPHTPNIQLNDDFYKNSKNILVCPHSSEERKSLSLKQLCNLLEWIEGNIEYDKITVAVQKNYYKDLSNAIGKKAKICYLNKGSSDFFLKLCKDTNLAFCVDSGPMHIFNTLQIKNIAYFSATLPQRILDKNTYTIAMRHEMLAGYMCEEKNCKEAACLHEIESNNISSLCEVNFSDMGTDIFSCPLKK